MENTFLTIEEAADLLRISPRSAYTLAREGRLEGAVKVGNQWRVNREALVEWHTKNRQATNSSDTSTDNSKKDSGL